MTICDRQNFYIIYLIYTCSLHFTSLKVTKEIGCNHVVLVFVLVLQDNNDSENFNAQLMLCSSVCQSDAQNTKCT